MSPTIYWFRDDLRLADNPVLAAAVSAADPIILVAFRSPEAAKPTRWGFPRQGAHRLAFRDQALRGLQAAVAARGGGLLIRDGRPEAVLPDIAQQIGAKRVFCEAIAAPEEIAEVAALRAAGLEVRETWQSSLLDPADLPFAIPNLPEVFTKFRQAVEAAGITPPPPVPAPEHLSPQPPGLVAPNPIWTHAPPSGPAAFPFDDPAFDGAEAAAQAHLARYFASRRPQTYKATRNGLIGPDYSTKFSPWLAVGALSARGVFQALRAHEDRFGANDSTYWILFELLWRDFFRFWSLKHGARLFRARGLSAQPPPRHDPEAFALWREGRTGHPFVDAGMRELAATGYLSNRMRQVVASCLIHDLGGDWRAGAAWFESRLIDYDVCSNQGNWLYLAGRGADPREGRRFNPDKQAADYDPDGAYRRLWADFAGPDLS
jgi:deoxyribodipyrimidine photo-lyase